MSLDKAIEHGKEKRKPYRGMKATDRWCCNHGPDEGALSDRLYSSNKRLNSTEQKLKDWDDEDE